MQKIFTTLCFVTAIGLIWFAATANADKDTMVTLSKEDAQSVHIENGVQIIRVLAFGGYSPKLIHAQSEIPTKLEVETKGTYDCSSAFTIPSLEYMKILPPTGITTIDIPPQSTGSSLLALCGMGMYSLEIQFI
jgi:plastocyanin domain-containing protein